MDEKHLDAKVTEEEAAKAVPAAPSLSSLTLESITKRLLAAEDAILELKAQVGDIRTREAAAEGKETDGAQQKAGRHPEPPSALELFYARMLEEAGLFDKDAALPQASAVMLHRSRLFYLRVQEPRVSYGAKLALIRIEAALNALIFASAYHKVDAPLTEREAYRTNQSVARSVASQIPTIADRLPTADEPFSDGEWAVRKGIASELETFRLPYRLEAGYRVNMHEGAVLFELAATPASCFPRSAWVEGLGRIVPTTAAMRRREASQYALRCALLLAGAAFRCSPGVKDVWVSAMETTAQRRSCLFSIHFDRRRFAHLDLDDIQDPFAVFAAFDAHMDPENEMLRPVPQELTLSDPRFCPAMRYEEPARSKRRIFGYSAKALGTTEVRGLAIDEEAGREAAAEEFGRHLGATAAESVSAILAATRDAKDPSVQEASTRTIMKLIDGTLDPADPLAIEEEFVSGDALTAAVRKARELMQARRAQDAIALLRDALASFEKVHPLVDTPDAAMRYFRTYIDRVFWNRLEAQKGQRAILLSGSFHEAHSMLAQALLEQNEEEEAARYAARMIGFAPFDAAGYMLYARAQNALQNTDGAKETVCLLLERAYDPETLGGSYAALGQIFEQQDDDVAAAAAYRRATRFVSSSYLMSIFALNQLGPKHPTEMANLATDEDVDAVLAAHGVPVAPTEEVSQIFVSGMRAAFDAEVFPAAKEFVDVLAMLSGDDVVLDISRSLEGEPDR